MPGWRVGWLCVHDRNNILGEVLKGYYRLSQMILGANGLVQSVIPTVLAPKPQSDAASELKAYHTKVMTQLQRNAMYTLAKLSKVQGLTVIEPQGAMYVMVGIDMESFADIGSDLQFCERLLQEEAVFVLPGKCFGMPNFFRVVFTAPMEKLRLAYARIGAFCARHAKEPKDDGK